MSDLKKSFLLRAALVGPIIAALMITVGVVDILIDKLPIWYGPGDHHFLECSFFLGWSATSIWRWLSRRVWIGSLPSHHRIEK